MININTELKINQRILKNRIVVPPMASQTADKEGFVTIDTLEHYDRLSQSEASLVMVEYSFVDITGKSEPNQLGISTDGHIHGLKLINQRIQRNGSLSAIQLVHSGAKSETSLTGGELIGPSAVAVPVKDREMEVPIKASQEHIDLIKRSFLAATRRAVKAGFDIVEIHAAHGYGINQWLSPLTNKRTDSYGGSRKNRAKILFEIIEDIKSKYPHLILSVRIPGQDYIEGGNSLEDSIWLSQQLEKRGVSIINVSSGMGGWRRPRDKRGEGYLVSDASVIAHKISAPVIGVGGIKTKDYINSALCRRDFSLAAIGRMTLENPFKVKDLLTA